LEFLQLVANQVALAVDNACAFQIEALRDKLHKEKTYLEEEVRTENVFPLLLPPLRERSDDVPRLVRHFTQRFARGMADAEKEHILGMLRETGWVVSGAKGAASRLGISRSTLQWKMKKLGISRPE
jgi:transcriptional regulator with GAF, ATPase, and Fis domain